MGQGKGDKGLIDRYGGYFTRREGPFPRMARKPNPAYQDCFNINMKDSPFRNPNFGLLLVPACIGVASRYIHAYSGEIDHQEFLISLHNTLVSDVENRPKLLPVRFHKSMLFIR